MAEKFVKEEGLAVALPVHGINTDQIMPRQFLKGTGRTGYGAHLFDALRFEDEGWFGKDESERQPRSDFVLNRPGTKGAKFLVTGKDFGCGSSREHAVWGLAQFGFKAVIAPSFADIFAENALRNGLLTINLTAEEIEEIIDMTESSNSSAVSVTVDLAAQAVRAGGKEYRFEIDPLQKKLLLEGMDDIAVSLQAEEAIEKWEAADKQKRPWLYHRLVQN